MKHTARFTKLALTLILLSLLPIANALAQGIVVEEIPVELISQNYLTITYIPLADVGTALGSAVIYDAGRNRYTAQPSEGGILKLSPKHVGVFPSENRPAPAAEDQRVSPTAQVMRRPQQPAEQPAVPQTMSFAIGDQLVSEGIVIIDGRPHMPLDDLAIAMGIIVVEKPSPERAVGQSRCWCRSEE